MVRSFYGEFARLRRSLTRRPPPNAARINGTIITGKLFAPVLRNLIDPINEEFGTRLSVEGIENRYFGSEIVVAGLLAGACVAAARDRIKGDFVILPGVAVKSDEPVMLDGTTLTDLERRLDLPVKPFDFPSFTRLFR